MITITEIIFGINNSSRKDHRITKKRSFTVQSIEQVEIYRKKLLNKAHKINANAYVDLYYITK